MGKNYTNDGHFPLSYADTLDDFQRLIHLTLTKTDIFMRFADLVYRRCLAFELIMNFTFKLNMARLHHAEGPHALALCRF